MIIWKWLVARASRDEIREMLNCVLKRYSELYPQWELSVITMDRRENPDEQISRMIEFLRRLRRTGEK